MQERAVRDNLPWKGEQISMNYRSKVEVLAPVVSPSECIAKTKSLINGFVLNLSTNRRHHVTATLCLMGANFYGINGASGYYTASWSMLLLQLNIGHISNQQEYNRSMMRRHILFYLF
jgi:hypothetical protein